MSTHKKRSLAGVIVNDSHTHNGNKIILPATSKSLGSDNRNSNTEAVRGTEFLVEPVDCRPWKFHNRDNVWMTTDKCQDLISSIRKNGQKVPIFARKIENDPDGKHWEIIAGRRRWFSCNYLGIKVRVKAIDSNDRDCAILMNLENKDRNDISEFEDAISYKQQLEANLFDNQEEMAIALDLKKSKLSKMLSASKITEHREIMSLFSDVTLLKINPIYALVLLIEKNNINKDLIINKAKALKDAFLNRKDVIKTNVIINELMSCVEEKEKKSIGFSRIYKIEDKIIMKAKKLTSRKIVFEFNKANFLDIPSEKIRVLTLEALEEFI
jgi:ParB family chromosome partitioning protein